MGLISLLSNRLFVVCIFLIFFLTNTIEMQYYFRSKVFFEAAVPIRHIVKFTLSRQVPSVEVALLMVLNIQFLSLLSIFLPTSYVSKILFLMYLNGYHLSVISNHFLHHAPVIMYKLPAEMRRITSCTEINLSTHSASFSSFFSTSFTSFS
jgi:hypothetical protein